jgi:hypothetical protein
MKTMHDAATKRTFGVCLFMATLLLGSAVAKADVVLDWNEIAVNTAIANGQNPIAQAPLCNSLSLRPSTPSLATINRILGASSRPIARQPTQQLSRLPIGCSAPISRPAP